MEEILERFRMLEGRLVESENRFQQHRQEAEAQVHRLQQENERLRQQIAQAVPPAPAVAPPPPAPRVRPPPPPRFAHPTKQNTTGEWLFQVEMHFLATGLDDLTQRIGYVATLLDGAASSWWSIRYADVQAGRIPPFPTWEDFKRTMVEFFHPTGLEMQARMDLRRLRQTGRVQAYCRIFQRLVTQVPSMDQGTIVDTFVHGLKDHVRAFVRQRRPRTLLEAIETAETYEVSTEEDYRGGHSSGHQGPAEPMELGSMLTGEDEEREEKEEEHRLNAISPRRRDSRGPDNRYRQRTPDRARHVSFGPGPVNRTGGRSPSPYRRTPDRPTTPRCYECGRFGHMARDCPKRQDRRASHEALN